MRKRWIVLLVLVLGLSASGAGVVVLDADVVSAAGMTLTRGSAIQASPQWNGERFVNSLPRQDGTLFEMLTKWLEGNPHRVPAERIPILKKTKSDFLTPPASGLRVTWLGHSTLIVEIDGYRVLVDPIWSRAASPVQTMGPKRFFEPPLPVDELPPIDAVVISHDHYDHLDRGTIKAIKDEVQVFAVPLGVGEYLEQWGVDPERIVERDWWEEARLGTLRLVATPARHFSGRSVIMNHQDQTLWSGWILKGPRHSVYYSGDTAMFPGFEEIGRRHGPFDVALIETGAYNALWRDVHLGPEQAVEAFQMVRGRLYIPVHWGTFDLALHSWTEPIERLLVAAKTAGVQLVVPQPGESVEPATPRQLVRWWPRVPWQTAEESPVISSGLQPREQPLRADADGGSATGAASAATP